jgi:hypothetical protein
MCRSVPIALPEVRAAAFGTIGTPIMSFLKTTSLSVLVSALLAVACSTSSDRPPPGGGATYGGPSPGGASGSSGGDGGSSSGDGGSSGGDGGTASCTGATQQGTEVAELRMEGAAPPALGGTIVAGTYVLVEANKYGPAQADAGDDGGATTTLTGVSARLTLDVTASTVRFFGARGPTGALPADAASGLGYVLAGTSLQTTAQCPTAGATKAIPFSAVGTGLALFTDATHRELYARK